MIGAWQNTKGLPRTLDGNKQEVVQPARFLVGTFSFPAPLSCSLNRVWAGFCLWTEDKYKHRRVTGYIEWSGIFHHCYCLLCILPDWTASLARSHGPPLWCSQGTQDHPTQGTCQAPTRQWKTRQGRQTVAGGGERKQWEKTEQPDKQPAQLPVTLVMDSFDFLSSFFLLSSFF